MRRALLAFGLLLLLAALSRLPTVLMQLDRDEATYALAAIELLDGGAPYRDLYDHKPPGIYYLYAVAFALLGTHTLAVRVLTTVAVALNALLLHRIASTQLGGRLAGWIAGALYLVYATSPALEGYQSNLEHFFLVPLLVGLWLVVDPASSRAASRRLALGVALGAALVLKPNSALNLMALLPLMPTEFRERQSAARSWLLLAAGALLPPLLAVAHLALLGALPAAWDALVGFNRGYLLEGLRQLRLPDAALAGVAREIWNGTWPLTLAALAGAILLRGQVAGRAILLWTGGGFAGALLSGRLFPHYFLQVLPGLTLLAAGLVATGSRAITRSGAPRAVAAAVLVLAAPALLALRGPAALVWRAPAALGHALRHPGAVPPAPAIAYRHERDPHVSQELVDAVRALTGPSDPILVEPASPEVYFYVGRPPASRFPTRWLALGSGHCQEHADALRQAGPKVVVTHALRKTTLHAEETVAAGCDGQVYVQRAGLALRARLAAGEVYGPAARHAEPGSILTAGELELLGEGSVARVGGLELLGHVMGGDGRSLQAWTYWRCLQPTPRDHTLFFHVVADDGTLLWQRDGYPGEGAVQTSRCAPGTLARDEYQVELPDAFCGLAHLLTGAYVRETLERLPALDAQGTRFEGDAIYLETRRLDC